MRTVEAITIYLAAGAPFGMSCYLRRRRGVGRTHALLSLVWAMLLWPVAAARILRARTRRENVATACQRSVQLRTQHEEKVEQARRQLSATLHKVQERARALSEKESLSSERVACVIRESVEKYVGLTIGANDTAADAPPTEREMELCRIAGRTGEDLLLAGRCIHRRNVARLAAHREHARITFLHALAEIRELSETADASSSARVNLVAARHMSVAVLRLYGEAVNLLSLLEDEDAAVKVARLMDAECARLRRLEAAVPDRSREEEHPAGEEPCKPHTHHLAFIGPSQTSPLTRG
jgi:hypothetical protein